MAEKKNDVSAVPLNSDEAGILHIASELKAAAATGECLEVECSLLATILP